MKTQTESQGPCHVERLDTITKLEAEGFTGPDASLSISLFEYGAAWRWEGDELIFIYGIPRGYNGEYKRFDRCTFARGLNVFREWSWAFDSHSFLEAYGITKEEWAGFPLEQQIYDLFSYFGSLEIMGECYWEGFKIADE